MEMGRILACKKKGQYSKDISVVFIKLFLMRPTAGAVSKYRLEGYLRDRLTECRHIANCPTLTQLHTQVC